MKEIEQLKANAWMCSKLGSTIFNANSIHIHIWVGNSCTKKICDELKIHDIVIDY